MRIHKLYQCFAAAVLLFLPVACDNTDYSEKSPFDNSAYLNIAASKNTETFTFNRKVTSQTKLSANISQKLFINNSLTVKSYYL